MKKKIQLAFLFATICSLAIISGCGSKKEPEEENKTEPGTHFEAVTYENPIAVSLSDITQYEAEVVDGGTSNDQPTDNGVIISPFFSLKVNDIDVPVYATRCTEGAHSFVWLDVDRDNPVLNVELTLAHSHRKVVVLPEKEGVVATLTDNKKVTATIKGTNSFTFAFDGKNIEPLTIYVAKKDECKLPDGYTLVEFEPKRYEQTELQLTQERTAYYFKKGFYSFYNLTLPSNSDVYFEPGTYMKGWCLDESDLTATISASTKSNINIHGRVLIDYSNNIGGMSGHQSKSCFSFTRVNNVTLSGMISINPNQWCCCWSNSTNFVVEKTMIFGYRTSSDGIMLSDCQDAIVRYNFVRTGDDAIEMKSTGSIGNKNLVYEYNSVWADKARCYGCIFESHNDAENITFRHNAVGFAKPTWSNYLGCCCVVMGTDPNVVWQNIRFEDFEIYYSDSTIINVRLWDDHVEFGGVGGTAQNLYFQNIVARTAYEFSLKISVNSASTLGKVFISNLNTNGHTFVESDLKDAYMSKISISSPTWKDSNIIIS